MENAILNSNNQLSKGMSGGPQTGFFFCLLRCLCLASAIATFAHAQSTSLTILQTNRLPFELITKSTDAYTIEQSSDFIHWSTLNGPWKGDQIVTLTNLAPGHSFFRAVEAPQTFLVGNGPGQFHSLVYSGAANQFMSEFSFTVQTVSENIRFVWASVGGVTGTTGELPFPNPYEMTASIQLTNGGTPVRLTFGGAPIKHVDGGLQVITSDPVIYAFQPGTNYSLKVFLNKQQSDTNSFVYNNVTYSGTLTNTYSGLPYNAHAYGSTWGTSDASVGYSPTSQGVFSHDLTGSSQPFKGNGDGVRFFAPFAIIGDVPAHQANGVVLIGDSLTTGDDEYYSFGQTNVAGSGLGWVGQAAYENLPFANLSIGAEGLTNWLSESGAALRSSFVPYARYVVDSLGGIDLAQGATFEQLTNYHTKVWLREATNGAKVFATTFQPRTTSTDGWRTITNQTIIPAFQGTTRSNYLVWLHTIPYPLTGLIDYASQVEVDINGNSTIGGGYWKPGGTNDTGTVTSVVGNFHSFTVTALGKSWNPNQWAGYTFWDLTQNQALDILGNTENTVTVDQRIVINPNDTFLINFSWTPDGTHLTQGAQTYLSTNVFPASLFAPY